MIKELSPQALGVKLATTFALNLAVAVVAAIIVRLAGVHTLTDAAVIGFALGIGFAGGGLGIAYTWEGRSLKLLMVDTGYPVLGITACTIINALWA